MSGSGSKSSILKSELETLNASGVEVQVDVEHSRSRASELHRL